MSDSDTVSPHGLDGDVQVQPTMMDAAALYVKRYNLDKMEFSPPNGRSVFLVMVGVNMVVSSGEPLLRYYLASDCSGIGTANYAMPCSQILAIATSTHLLS